MTVRADRKHVSKPVNKQVTGERSVEMNSNVSGNGCWGRGLSDEVTLSRNLTAKKGPEVEQGGISDMGNRIRVLRQDGTRLQRARSILYNCEGS